jgi:putative thioredoxin
MRAVTEQDFETTVLTASKTRPVLVDFWAPWCGPCRMLSPILEQLAGELGAQVDIVKLNTDEQPALAQTFQIRSIPAVKLFHHGKVVAEFVGVQPATRIRELLAPYLAPAADDPVVVAGAQLEAGDALAATRILDQLPADRQASDQVRMLYARAHFVALAQLDSTDSPDMAVRTTAARALLAGDHASAMQILLAHMASHGRFARAEGRTDLLRVFELVPPEHPDVAAARRRLAALLN